MLVKGIKGSSTDIHKERVMFQCSGVQGLDPAINIDFTLYGFSPCDDLLLNNYPADIYRIRLGVHVHV